MEGTLINVGSILVGWLSLVMLLVFGGDQIIATNDRSAQRKIIKDNHLVANCAIFYNVVVMSHVLREMQAEGQPIDPDAIAALSPYITEHIDRFGCYSLEMDQPPPPLDESIFSTTWLQGIDHESVAGESSHPPEHGAGPVQLPFDGW